MDAASGLAAGNHGLDQEFLVRQAAHQHAEQVQADQPEPGIRQVVVPCLGPVLVVLECPVAAGNGQRSQAQHAVNRQCPRRVVAQVVSGIASDQGDGVFGALDRRGRKAAERRQVVGHEAVDDAGRQDGRDDVAGVDVRHPLQLGIAVPHGQGKCGHHAPVHQPYRPTPDQDNLQEKCLLFIVSASCHRQGAIYSGVEKLIIKNSYWLR